MLLSEFLKIYKDKAYYDESFLRMIYYEQPAVWASRLSDKSMFPCTHNEWLTFMTETPEEEIERRRMYRELYEYNEQYKIKLAHVKDINSSRVEYEC